MAHTSVKAKKIKGENTMRIYQPEDKCILMLRRGNRPSETKERRLETGQSQQPRQ